MCWPGCSVNQTGIAVLQSARPESRDTWPWCAAAAAVGAQCTPTASCAGGDSVKRARTDGRSVPDLTDGRIVPDLIVTRLRRGETPWCGVVRTTKGGQLAGWKSAGGRASLPATCLCLCSWVYHAGGRIHDRHTSHTHTHTHRTRTGGGRRRHPCVRDRGLACVDGSSPRPS